jgi:hypothetical protein
MFAVATSTDLVQLVVSMEKGHAWNWIWYYLMADPPIALFVLVKVLVMALNASIEETVPTFSVKFL